jgi:Fe-S-cluster containining protein
MLEIDQEMMSSAMAAVRKGMPSCMWSAAADRIVAERAKREAHLRKPASEIDQRLIAGLETLRREGVVIHPLKMEAGKVADIRRYLEAQPAYGGFHIFSSDRRLRPLADVRRESSMAGYTADQVLRAPHVVDFFNQPAIVDFIEPALGCVPTLYSVNAWWSFPARTPTDRGAQYFHRDTDDWRFFTLFLYLTDVDEGSGPHQLVAGSHTLEGTERLLARARAAGRRDVPFDALDSFTNYFGDDFSQRCERLFNDSVTNIAGDAGTIFTANTVALHRGLVPTKTPRLIVWARYGLGPNTNSVDLEQPPVAFSEIASRLPDTPRNRYVNRLLIDFGGTARAAGAASKTPVGATLTANLRLTVGDLKIAQPVTAPVGAVPAVEVIPALQGLVNAVVEAAEKQSAASGKEISCRKGCGACCRQLVPISRTEGEALLALVEAMPAERQEAVRSRFAAAEATISKAGLVERAGRSDREMSLGYFALKVPCPFLEEESCSIHPDRPLVCREYLVTSPAELCSGPAQEGVTPVAVPKVSLAARRLQDDKDEWFPLALLMHWARSRPPHQRGDVQRQPGPQWIERFLKLVTVK